MQESQLRHVFSHKQTEILGAGCSFSGIMVNWTPISISWVIPIPSHTLIGYTESRVTIHNRNCTSQCGPTMVDPQNWPKIMIQGLDDSDIFRWCGLGRCSLFLRGLACVTNLIHTYSYLFRLLSQQWLKLLKCLWQIVKTCLKFALFLCHPRAHWVWWFPHGKMVMFYSKLSVYQRVVPHGLIPQQIQRNWLVSWRFRRKSMGKIRLSFFHPIYASISIHILSLHRVPPPIQGINYYRVS